MKKLIVTKKELPDFISSLIDICENEMAYYAGHDREYLEKKLLLEITEDEKMEDEDNELSLDFSVCDKTFK